MEKARNFLFVLGLGITIGVILVVILVFVFGGIPKKVTVGGVEFEIPTATIQAQPPSVSQQIEQPNVQSFAPVSITSIPTSNDKRDIAAQTLGYANLDGFMVAFGILTEVKPRKSLSVQMKKHGV